MVAKCDITCRNLATNSFKQMIDHKLHLTRLRHQGIRRVQGLQKSETKFIVGHNLGKREREREDRQYCVALVPSPFWRRARQLGVRASGIHSSRARKTVIGLGGRLSYMVCRGLPAVQLTRSSRSSPNLHRNVTRCYHNFARISPEYRIEAP